MTQFYSDPDRANDKWSLPDCEVFYLNDVEDETGWYYWYCLPGCLPDSDPFGPYPTEAAAIEAAQEWVA